MSDVLAARGLKPIAELAKGRDHGDRLVYRAGCRCGPCRRANTEYESQRQRARKAGDWNGIVSASRARAHLIKLSRQGVGRRAVRAATDIADTVLQKIRSGKKQNIRARTERLILCVTPASASDRALVRAGPTRARIAELLNEQFTVARLARELGQSTPRLQIGKRLVTVRTQYNVEQMHRRLMS